MLTNKEVYLELFRDIGELKALYTANVHTVIVWGTGVYAGQVFMTLEAFGIPVAYFGDNNKKRVGEKFFGKKIIGADSLKDVQAPFIISGSMFIHTIYEQFRSMGIHDIYAILECLKYPYADHISDREALSKYFDDYDKNVSERVLVEIYGFIGDVIIKSGIIKALINRFGYENVYFFCDSSQSSGVADILRLFSNNILTIDHRAFVENMPYRLDMLRLLNSKYFNISISLSGLENHSGRRVLNSINFNTRRIAINKYIYFHTYMLEQDVKFTGNFLDIPVNKELYPKGCIDDAVEKVAFKYDLPIKYIAVGIGARDKLRFYDATKFAKVADFLIEKGYYLTVLGYGSDDNEYFDVMMNTITVDKNKVVSFINHLTVPESLYAIKHSDFFVGMESGMWNASYVLDKPSVVIYGGGDYGGFKHIDPKIRYVSVEKRNCFNCQWWCTHKTPAGRAECIDDIAPEQIINAVQTLISEAYVKQ